MQPGAGERGIFDQLHRRIGIAHAIAAFGRGLDHFGPIAVVRRRDLFERGVILRRRTLVGVVAAAGAERKGERERADADPCDGHFFSPPILPTTGIVVTTGAPSPWPSSRASDSRQARSSGSATSRSDSPSSAGIGRSDGGGVRGFAFAPARCLPERDPRHRGVAEEHVDPFDDYRRDMLHQGRMGALDRQVSTPRAWRRAESGSIPARRRRRSGCADDLAPAAHHRRLDEAEAAEGAPPAFGRRSETARARRE